MVLFMWRDVPAMIVSGSERQVSLITKGSLPKMSWEINRGKQT